MTAQLISRTRKRRLGEDELGAWRALVRAYAAVTRALERDAEAEGRLPLFAYWLLLALWQGPTQGVRLTALADQTFLTKSGLTRAVDRLEADGLVERRVCPSDGRGQLAVLTPRGRRAVVRSSPAHFRGIASYFADELTDREAAVIRKALDRVGDRAERHGEATPV